MLSEIFFAGQRVVPNLQDSARLGSQSQRVIFDSSFPFFRK